MFFTTNPMTTFFDSPFFLMFLSRMLSTKPTAWWCCLWCDATRESDTHTNTAHRFSDIESLPIDYEKFSPSHTIFSQLEGENKVKVGHRRNLRAQLFVFLTVYRLSFVSFSPAEEKEKIFGFAFFFVFHAWMSGIVRRTLLMGNSNETASSRSERSKPLLFLLRFFNDRAENRGKTDSVSSSSRGNPKKNFVFGFRLGKRYEPLFYVLLPQTHKTMEKLKILVLQNRKSFSFPSSFRN